MQFSCYIEVNLICLILLAIVYARLRQNRSINTTPQMIMRRMIVALWVLCLSDIAAIVFRGRVFPGARLLIEGSNLIYLEMMPVISMFWYAYVCNRTGKEMNKRQVFFRQLPVLIFTLVALSNPINHFIFSIDENNLYARGPGVFLHWIISWYYLFSAGALSAKAIRTAPSWVRRSEYKPLLHFLVLPIIGSVAQMIFYGVTSVQGGITLSVVLISMQSQDNQISLDELTGINNRKAMRRYVDNMVHKNNPPSLMVMMIDVNKFKRINDTLGHSVGDMALCDIAGILKGVCGKAKERLFLSRYGGDEFVIIGKDMKQEAMDGLVDAIHRDVAAFGREQKKPYTLDVSVGYAWGACGDYDDFSRCMKAADEAMYQDKKKRS